MQEGPFAATLPFGEHREPVLVCYGTNEQAALAYSPPYFKLVSTYHIKPSKADAHCSRKILTFSCINSNATSPLQLNKRKHNSQTFLQVNREKHREDHTWFQSARRKHTNHHRCYRVRSFSCTTYSTWRKRQTLTPFTDHWSPKTYTETQRFPCTKH